MKLILLLLLFTLSTTSFASENCPSRSEIKKAIHRHQELMCMTQKEVIQSAPIKYRDDFGVDRWADKSTTFVLWRYYKRKEY